MYNKSYVLKHLKRIFGKNFKDQVFINKKLSDITSFRVGGVADYVVMPKTIEEIVRLAIFLKETKVNHYILGNGSNVLASDDGFSGVIVWSKELKGIEKADNILKVMAGESLTKVCMFANSQSLAGLQDGAGIPGTVVGAVIMNASAYGYETKDVVLGVLAIIDGKITYFKKHELEFSYRNSVFKKLKNAIILRVDFMLQAGNKIELSNRSEEILVKRRTNQPLEYPSAGSVFKRIEGIIISKMIDEEGLKGYTIGGAEVSKKHAGFIINQNNACAKDIYNLILHIKNIFKDKHNLELEEEIKYVGKF